MIEARPPYEFMGVTLEEHDGFVDIEPEYTRPEGLERKILPRVKVIFQRGQVDQASTPRETVNVA